MIQELSVEWVASFPGAAYAQLTAQQTRIARQEALLDAMCNLADELKQGTAVWAEKLAAKEADCAQLEKELAALSLERTPTDLVCRSLRLPHPGGRGDMLLPVWVMPYHTGHFEEWKGYEGPVPATKDDIR